MSRFLSGAQADYVQAEVSGMRQNIPYPRIRDLREDHDWSQSQVAHLLNLTQTCYSKYEIGTSEIPVKVVIQLARLYDVSIDYLLGESSCSRRV